MTTQNMTEFFYLWKTHLTFLLFYSQLCCRSGIKDASEVVQMSCEYVGKHNHVIQIHQGHLAFKSSMNSVHHAL